MQTLRASPGSSRCARNRRRRPLGFDFAARDRRHKSGCRCGSPSPAQRLRDLLLSARLAACAAFSHAARDSGERVVGSGTRRIQHARTEIGDRVLDHASVKLVDRRSCVRDSRSPLLARLCAVASAAAIPGRPDAGSARHPRRRESSGIRERRTHSPAAGRRCRALQLWSSIDFAILFAHMPLRESRRRSIAVGRAAINFRQHVDQKFWLRAVVRRIAIDLEEFAPGCRSGCRWWERSRDLRRSGSTGRETGGSSRIFQAAWH